MALSLHPFIFLVPPILVLLAYALGLAPAGWSQAILFLAILPTTISSCVVYTRLAGGDADEALGHATFSNLLAVVWVPVAWGAFLSSDGESVGVTQSMGLFLGDLLVLMILPCLAGWWARKKLENRLVGLPMAHLLVGSDHSAVGELVLPLVLFHFGQLLLGSLLLGILGGGRSAR